MTVTPVREYPGTTASMQADPEAHHFGGVASESSVGMGAFPVDRASCASTAGELEWVPDSEARLVPEEMLALCRACPGRQDCLLWALREEETGYWAGTTTADRTALASVGQGSIESADWLQQLARLEAQAQLQEEREAATHPPGMGNYREYRRFRCRCGECRAANAARKATERARQRRSA